MAITIHYKDIKSLDAAIKSVATRGQKLDLDIQKIGISALHHLETNGDIGAVNRLYLALGKGHRKGALVQWLLAYGKCVANVAEDKKDKPFVYAKDRVTNLEEAVANPWYDFKQEVSPDMEFDVQAALIAIIKRATNKNVSDPKLLNSIKELVEGSKVLLK